MKVIRNSNLNAVLSMAKEMAPIEYTRPAPRPSPTTWTLTRPVPSFNAADHIPCRAVLCCPMPDGTMRREYAPMHGKSVMVRNARRALPVALRKRARYELQMRVYESCWIEGEGALTLRYLREQAAKRPTLHLKPGARRA